MGYGGSPEGGGAEREHGEEAPGKRRGCQIPLPFPTTPPSTKRMWVGVTMGTAYNIPPLIVFNFLTGSFVSLHHCLPAKQRRGSAGGEARWSAGGNLPLRLETQDLDWCSRWWSGGCEESSVFTSSF